MVSQERALDPQPAVVLEAAVSPVAELVLRLAVELAVVLFLSLATSPVHLTLTSAVVPSLDMKAGPASELLQIGCPWYKPLLLRA